MLASLAVASHPLLCLHGLAAEFAVPLAQVPALVSDPLAVPVPADVPAADDAVRARIRDLLRHGGFKPTGRSKPSSEYLLRALAEDQWPQVNAAVDIANLVSLRSGVPISVVDLDRVEPPLRIAAAPLGSRFVFNASGQVIDVGGLLGLSDAQGPCANAVKDAQRSKTDASTRRVLVLLWGHIDDAARVEAAARWASELLRALLPPGGSRVEPVACAPEAGT
ncbi:MAG: phenylalanine--tRNA ligase beta subunit-related protein [Planctomycetota bacterium]